MLGVVSTPHPNSLLLLTAFKQHAAVPDSPMNINARILKENRLRRAKAEKQIYERIARAYDRTCSGVQVGTMDIPAIFRTVRVAMALTPECSDEALDRMVAATLESYRKN